MKLLILKTLYVLFSSNLTAEYFYTNDLCVLVDVFLRELADLDENSESVRLFISMISIVFNKNYPAETYVSSSSSPIADQNAASRNSI